MDFLTNAIFSDTTGMLLGAMITHFNPDDYTSRASVKLHTLSELQSNYQDLEPRGFRFEQPGLLPADTDVRKVFSKSAMSFVEAEYSKLGIREVDITDLVLYGVQNGGCTIVNYPQVKEQGVAPILLPFANYRVSASSFNIYGAAKMADGTYKTHSMLELEDGSGKSFYAAFPMEADLSPFASICQQLEDIKIRDTDMVVYRVSSCLKPFYACVGEAFLNYLAYHVAYYNVGRKFLREIAPLFMESTQQEEMAATAQERRYPKRNVSIEHAYDKLCLKGLSACSGDNERLIEYLQEVPEARITMHWMSKFFDSPWYKDGVGTDEERARTASANLMMECRENGLKYGLELLTHRYYLATIPVYEDILPIVLKGGGVDGESVKRVSLK